MERNDEHYVDNEEFYKLLCEIKTIIEKHFNDDIKDIDFSKGVEKLKFKKQLSAFEITQIKHHIKQKNITLSDKEQKHFEKIQTKIAKLLKPKRSFDRVVDDKTKDKLNECKINMDAFIQSIHITQKIRAVIERAKKVEKKRLQIAETKRRKNKMLIKLVRSKETPKGTYRRLQNKLGLIFLSICRGVLTKPNFINYTWDRKDDMTSEATFHMSRYVLLFDTEQLNPFAYFTTVCNRAFLQCLNKQNRYNEKVQPLVYIENMHTKDNLQVEDWD